jgi:hypothetical protein
MHDKAPPAPDALHRGAPGQRMQTARSPSPKTRSFARIFASKSKCQQYRAGTARSRTAYGDGVLHLDVDEGGVGCERTDSFGRLDGRAALARCASFAEVRPLLGLSSVGLPFKPATSRQAAWLACKDDCRRRARHTSIPLRSLQGSRVHRELSQTFAGRREDRVGDRGRNRRRSRLADSAGGLCA